MPYAAFVLRLQRIDFEQYNRVVLEPTPAHLERLTEGGFAGEKMDVAERWRFKDQRLEQMRASMPTCRSISEHRNSKNPGNLVDRSGSPPWILTDE
jgi:hypothetical protein